jgi:hypothetical protein
MIDVQHKIIFKGSSQYMCLCLCVFTKNFEILTPNLQKFVYCFNHQVIITDTQHKVYLHTYFVVVKLLEIEFEIVEPCI